MERRKILKIAVGSFGCILTGGTLSALLSGCQADPSPKWAASHLNQDQFSLIQSLLDVYLPRTETPGALDAFVDRYIDEAYGNYFSEEEQTEFIQQIDYFNNLAINKETIPFVALESAKQNDILELAFTEADEDRDHPFFKIRSLAVSAYFTSELVAKEVLYYDPMPGPFQGCVPISEVGGVSSAL